MFAMLIKNSLYISGVFIKISKNVFKNGLQQQQKIQTAYTSELQLKRTLFWVFLISFKKCYAFEFYISTLKQKKTYYVEEEEKEEIPNRKMKMKTTKKWKENCT